MGEDMKTRASPLADSPSFEKTRLIYNGVTAN